jgi:hypothetical protein
VVIGTVRSDNFEALVERTSRSSVSDRWKREMSPYFQDLGGATPDLSSRELDANFSLDEQFRALRDRGES